MTAIEDFLRARLDDDERLAKAATANVWTIDPWTNEHGGEFLVVADITPGPPAFAIKNQADAEHIACHDPARILADVAAKRAILARATHDEQFPTLEAGYECAIEDVVQLLALPYANHPEYDERWRP